MGIAVGVVGIATTIFGGITQANAAKQSNAAENQIIAGQQQQAALQNDATALEARRKQLEVVRTQQRSRALALSNAVGSGAAGPGSSGLQGGFGQISGETTTSELDIQQQEQLTQSSYNVGSSISASRIALANAQMTQSFGAGLSTFGGSLVSNSKQIASIGANFGIPNFLSKA